MLWNRIEPLIRWLREFCQDQWFDRTRRVRTSGNVALHRAGLGDEELRDSEIYQPARPAHIRRALREAPVRDLSSYSFIDLGSGKGRSLFIAAEFSFTHVTGVEFSPLLHAEAVRNIQSFRDWRRGYRQIKSLHQNAKDFVFPSGPLVVYMFNPFGVATMQCVLDNLVHSLECEPRHVVIVLMWPRCEQLVAQIDGMQWRRTTKEYQIYDIHSELSG